MAWLRQRLRGMQGAGGKPGRAARDAAWLRGALRRNAGGSGGGGDGRREREGAACNRARRTASSCSAMLRSATSRGVGLERSLCSHTVVTVAAAAAAVEVRARSSDRPLTARATGPSKSSKSSKLALTFAKTALEMALRFFFWLL